MKRFCLFAVIAVIIGTATAGKWCIDSKKSISERNVVFWMKEMGVLSPEKMPSAEHLHRLL